MADWFTSDPHFGHENILKFENEHRPYSDVIEMNEAIVRNINEKVSQEDTLYILGDVAFSSKYQYLGRLLAKKIIVILGNHDYPNKIASILQYDNVKIAGCLEYKGCILTHIPVHASQLQRYRANIHGHLHDAFINDPRYYNVGLERHEMKPILWDSIARIIPNSSANSNDYYEKLRNK